MEVVIMDKQIDYCICPICGNATGEMHSMKSKKFVVDYYVDCQHIILTQLGAKRSMSSMALYNVLCTYFKSVE